MFAKGRHFLQKIILLLSPPRSQAGGRVPCFEAGYKDFYTFSTFHVVPGSFLFPSDCRHFGVQFEFATFSLGALRTNNDMLRLFMEVKVRLNPCFRRLPRK